MYIEAMEAFTKSSNAFSCAIGVGSLSTRCGDINIGGNAYVKARGASCYNFPTISIGGAGFEGPYGDINVSGNAILTSGKSTEDTDGSRMGAGLNGNDNNKFFNSINIGGKAIVVIHCFTYDIPSDYRITPVIGRCKEINISGGFIIVKNAENTTADDIGKNSLGQDVNSLKITGGSVYCVNGRISEKAEDGNGNKVYPCFVPRNINSVDLKGKEITSGRYNDHYDAMMFNDKVNQVLSDNGFNDLFPSNDLAGCLYLPEGEHNAAIKGSSNFAMRANVGEEKLLYNDVKYQSDKSSNWFNLLNLSPIYLLNL